jgi:hypothetical protein
VNDSQWSMVGDDAFIHIVAVVGSGFKAVCNEQVHLTVQQMGKPVYRQPPTCNQCKTLLEWEQWWSNNNPTLNRLLLLPATS